MPAAILGSIALSLSAIPAHGATEPTRDADHESHRQPVSLRDTVTVTGAGAATPASTSTFSAASVVGAAAASTTYTVKRGDTISAIAARHGLRTKDLLAWNGLGWSSTIFPGQTLKLSGTAAASAPAAPKAATSAGNTYTVKRGDTLWAISRTQGTSVANLMKLNGLSAGSIIHPGQKLALSAGTTAPASAPAASKPAASTPPASTGSASKTHTVAKGDTLWAIANTHGVSVSTLLTLNGLKSSSIIYPGQKLSVKMAAAPASSSAAPAPSAPAPKPAAPGGASHTVAAGETVWAIAQKHGTSVAALLSANGLGDASIIYPGQKLTIPSATGLDAEQTANAQLIIKVGRDRGVPERGIAIALATAMVESGIRNLDYGDRDSQGLFQQRPSQGWGTVAQITDPYRSTATFYGGPQDPNGATTRGLLDIAGWQSMAFTDAAQAVQISAFPDRYGQWETTAFGWLAALG
ncbi:LysM peptidoglycan-binding domain-containing protein [Microbacterium invictum]|uniref:LysM repeat protein n=2 Tax=Microbacterium invictum TaxID=515415 RepID=A0AA40SNC1_9MICO|nr:MULTISPECIES: LysM peptidoglycan-binding domain-containing protein [Microbacterium]MBB4139391.1 LysM repeat protein [Microbacterium invictum]